MDIEVYIVRLSTALLFGAIIGIERQWRQKSAGLRTNTLVSLGSAAFIMLSIYMTGSSGDPSRVASQIVTGIGFLGAGVIIKDGFTVQGLNTAATIWCSAAVGSLSGIGLWREAGTLTIFIVIVHLILRPAAIILSRISFTLFKDDQYVYKLTATCISGNETELREEILNYAIRSQRMVVHALGSSQETVDNHTVISAEIIAPQRVERQIEELAAILQEQEKIVQVRWEIIEQRHIDV